jgi:hypothetical protein
MLKFHPGDETMRCRKARLFIGAMTLVLLTSVAANGGDIAICSIVEKPADFNHQNVTLQGAALGVKETTSHRGNDYTTFKLQDPSGCGAVNIFTWVRLTVGPSRLRSHLIHRSARDIIPPLGGTRVSSYRI